MLETLAELDNLKQQFAEYEELLVDLQGENEELKNGGGGDGGELKKQLEEEKKKNKALQEVCLIECGVFVFKSHLQTGIGYCFCHA